MDEFKFWLLIASIIQFMSEHPFIVLLGGIFIGKIWGLTTQFLSLKKLAMSFEPHFDNYKIVPYDWFWDHLNERCHKCSGFEGYTNEVKKL